MHMPARHVCVLSLHVRCSMSVAAPVCVCAMYRICVCGCVRMLLVIGKVRVVFVTVWVVACIS